MTDKPTFEHYLEEAVTALGFGSDAAKAESSYKINLVSAQQAVLRSETLKGILQCLHDMRSRYANGNIELLFYQANPATDLNFQQKPFNSAIHKLYRRDVTFNRAFPKPPPGGNADPKEIYNHVDDLIRSRIVCKYMDGPSFVCNELGAYCEANKISFRFHELSTQAGYYAWHFYFAVNVDLLMSGDVVQRDLWIEIQLSTQLSEAITALTHGLYEIRRTGEPSAQRDWKWDANSPQFKSAYIGHGLHLLEGMIQTFRDDVLAAQTSDLQTLGKVASASSERGAEITAIHASPDAEQADGN